VSDEFFKDHEAPEIAAKLGRFTLAEHLRELANTPVIVTNSGLKLEHE
jgi:hypothetical protein